MKGRGMIRQARQVLGKEIRTLARDRHTVIYSVLVPLFLYPALIWFVIQVLLYARGLEERMVSRVEATAPDGAEGLLGFLSGKPDLQLVPRPPASGAEGEDDENDGLRRRLASRQIDALVTVRRRGEGGGARGQGTLHVNIAFHGARDSSVLAAQRMEKYLEEFRREALLSLARSRGRGEEFLDALEVEEVDLSSRQELSNYIASMILPLILVIMTALGALYPALECTVGERERGTLETTLASPASRISIVLGKYGAVVLFALGAFLLNFASMWFTLSHLEDQMKLEGFRLGAASAAIVFCAALLLALLLSSLMMVLGFVARSYREGQSYVTPVYLVAMLPAMFAASGDLHLDGVLPAIPVLNITLVFGEALRGQLPAAGVVVALVSSTVYAALAILLASWLLRREELAVGDGAGLRGALAVFRRRRERRPAARGGKEDDT